MNTAPVSIASPELELVFEPEQGGKWRSLKDRRTGYEWFWRNPHLSIVPIQYGDSFIAKHDTGGWDEVFPSVSPCGNIPDHGDLVQLPWHVEAQTENRLTLSVEGRCLPFHFSRTVEVEGTWIHCVYRLENTGTGPFNWLWCAHPLFPLAGDTRLQVENQYDVLFAFGATRELERKVLRLEELPWSGESAWAVKLFSRCGEVDRITLQQPGGAELRISWDANEVPYLGLWINRGAWSGSGSPPYFNTCIEPATLPVDDLSQADHPPELAPGEVKNWRVDLEVRAGYGGGRQSK